MAVGAQDNIDRLLVKKYASKQVDNHEDIVSKMIDPNKMMETMKGYFMRKRDGIKGEVSWQAKHRNLKAT